MVQVEANSEEEAINLLRHNMEGHVTDLTIDNITLKTTLPEGLSSEDFNPNKTIN